MLEDVKAFVEGNKAGFDERAFHDAILTSGALPMPVLRRHLQEKLKPVPPPPKPKNAPAEKKLKPAPKRKKPAPRKKPKPRPKRRAPRRRGK